MTMTDEMHGGEASQVDEPMLRDHKYDGIQEYDNPMPSWWLWILWATIIFAPVYFLGVHVFGFIPSYQDDLQASQAELTAIRAAAASNAPPEVTAETIAAFVGNADAVKAGSETFAANCMMCHGEHGQGLIGPNLTDEYWLHGGNDIDLFHTITNGVPEKGMAPWGNVLTQEKRLQLVAFIRSLAGSNPTGGKGPEGERFPGADATG